MDRPADRWSQIRVGNVLVSMAFFGAFLMVAKWTALVEDPEIHVLLGCVPLLGATVGALFGRPFKGVFCAYAAVAPFVIAFVFLMAVSGIR